MKQKLLVVAVSGALAAMAAPASFAQSTATISGSIQVGVHATGAPGRAGDAGIVRLGSGANAINIDTAEDLGGGLKTGLTSQIRFDPATGDRNSHGTGNALMHTANVYFTGGFGTFRIGKIGEASNCGFDPWKCTGGVAMMAPNGTGGAQSALHAGGTTANAFSYVTPNVNGLSASYQSSMTGARVNERRLYSIDYAQGPVGLQFLQSNNTANTAADVAGAAPTINDAKARGQSLSGSYNLGVAKVSVSNTVLKDASFKTSNITMIAAEIPMGAYTWLLGSNKAKTASGGNYTGITGANDSKFSAGVNYALSKRTTLGADIMKAEAVDGSSGFSLRVRHTF